MEEKQRKLKLNPITVNYSSGNRIPSSVKVKRKATIREAMFICREILGFDLNLSLSEMDAVEKDEFRQDVTRALNGFLDGGDWSCLCDACQCWDDVDAINFAPFLWMVSYCQEKGIL